MVTSASARHSASERPRPRSSIWDAAVAEAKRRRANTSVKDDKAPRESTLLLIGSKGAGKTTLLQRFLDKEEAPRKTLALEYTYGRKSGKTLVKDVCHLWELGGGSTFTSLLQTPINLRVFPFLTAIIMLDLSRPEALWNDMETLLQAIKTEVSRVLNSAEAKQTDLEEQLMEQQWRRLGSDHQDREHMSPLPIPLVIVGGKYDVFQDMEPEGKKLIAKALRFMAHIHGASLQFFSAKDAGLIKKAKELLSHHGFNTQDSKSLSQDYNKPLLIPAGSDSLTGITGSVDETQASLTVEAWRHTFTARFPQETDQKSSIIPEDPTKDPAYIEPDIDNLRAQKDEELERIRRQVGHSSTRWADLDIS
ncbi:unnamed protein product [Meganyctiphanes norvegica]|uniref:Cytoplasmic dynein 2 light intermediate chain 1 n=1 Tax=Meganyctiphanes norvegica TaxID=48144 RepID=A0AAV2QMS4_MEGNR